MNESAFIKKMKELFIGKRSLKERFLTALFASLALSLTLFLFGPAELAAGAGLSVMDVLPSCLKIWALFFAAVFLPSWLLGGKMHSWLCSLFMGLAAAFYIQRHFLNGSLQIYDDSYVWWQDYHNSGFLNLLIFLLIVMLPFMIRFFSRKLWKRCIIAGAVILLVLQVVPFGKTLTDDPRGGAPETAALTSRAADELSSDAFQKLIWLSFYRDFPLMMKAPFQMGSDFLQDIK